MPGTVPPRATTTRTCTGVSHTVADNGDGTSTDHYTAIFSGGNPPGAETSAVAQFNNLPGSTANFSNQGLTVDVDRAAGWKITALNIKVSSSELIYNGGIYPCPTGLPSIS